MCCIFTCFGWMIDLIQRFWTFTMSCCISSAVCCSLVTASMSGVALGYNYSLAEYIETKETNVSIFMKRGVFDDGVDKEMQYRRSEQKDAPPEENNFYTSSARRSDSIFDEEAPKPANVPASEFMSDDRYKFEGSLMKLTAKPTELDLLAKYTPTPVLPVSQVFGDIGDDSFEKMRAVQSVINRRKIDEATYTPIRVASRKSVNAQMSELETIQNLINQRKQIAKHYATARPTMKVNNRPEATPYPAHLYSPSDRPPTIINEGGGGRRMMDSNDQTTEFSDIMKIVRAQENERAPKWYQPRPPTNAPSVDMHGYRIIATPRAGPLTPRDRRPEVTTTPEIADQDVQTPEDEAKEPDPHRRIGYDSELDELYKKYTMPSGALDSFQFRDYNDEEIKGLPVRRRKRSLGSVLNKDSPLKKKMNKGDVQGQSVTSGKGPLHKVKTVIENMIAMISFAGVLNSDISEINIKKPADIKQSVNVVKNFPSVTSTAGFISKISKSMMVS